jgi:ATP-binding cassette subfamily A (ABC1) protein 1
LKTIQIKVKDIVYEKEKRLKEFMRVMGLSNGIHWLAWFITAFVTMFLICILLVIILKYGKITQYSDFGALLVFFVCFSMATITQCFLISVFFNRANLAAAVGGKLFDLDYYSSLNKYFYLNRYHLFPPISSLLCSRQLC